MLRRNAIGPEAAIILKSIQGVLNSIRSRKNKMAIIAQMVRSIRSMLKKINHKGNSKYRVLPKNANDLQI